MPVLKDFYCLTCETETEQLVDGKQEKKRAFCTECGTVRVHRSMCSGGIKNRYTLTEFDLIHHPEEHIQFLGLKTGVPKNPDTIDETINIEPTRINRTNEILHDRPQYQPDAMAEKQKRRKHARLTKLGRQRVTVSAPREATSARGQSINA